MAIDLCAAFARTLHIVRMWSITLRWGNIYYGWKSRSVHNMGYFLAWWYKHPSFVKDLEWIREAWAAWKKFILSQGWLLVLLIELIAQEQSKEYMSRFSPAVTFSFPLQMILFWEMWQSLKHIMDIVDGLYSLNTYWTIFSRPWAMFMK